MPPIFPSFERIELKRPPLQLVVCQVRFPPILELVAGDPPVKFQEALKHRYPVTHRDQSLEMRSVGGEAPLLRTSHHWRFDDADSKWTVSLGDSFLSLETGHYRRFTDFVQRFDELLDISRDLFPLEIRDRFGLRYIDRLSKRVCPNLPDNWLTQIQSDLIPLRGWRGEGEPQKGQLETRYAFDGQILTIRCTTVDRGFSGADEDEFVLDIDCYCADRAPLGNLAELMRDFKQMAYNVFRWAVGDLISSFGPAETE